MLVSQETIECERMSTVCSGADRRFITLRQRTTCRVFRGHHKDKSGRQPQHKRYDYDSSSVVTSDLESSTVLDSDDSDSDMTSRMSTTTDESSVSRIYQSRHLQMRRRRKKKAILSGAPSSVSSVTDSSMSLNIITVMLNLGAVSFSSLVFRLSPSIYTFILLAIYNTIYTFIHLVVHLLFTVHTSLPL